MEPLRLPLSPRRDSSLTPPGSPSALRGLSSYVPLRNVSASFMSGSDPLPELPAFPDGPWMCHTAPWLFTWGLQGRQPCLCILVPPAGVSCPTRAGGTHSTSQPHPPLYKHPESLASSCEALYTVGPTRSSPSQLVLVREGAGEHFLAQLKTCLGMKRKAQGLPPEAVSVRWGCSNNTTG